jgi:hypothetical protein
MESIKTSGLAGRILSNFKINVAEGLIMLALFILLNLYTLEYTIKENKYHLVQDIAIILEIYEFSVREINIYRDYDVITTNRIHDFENDLLYECRVDLSMRGYNTWNLKIHFDTYEYTPKGWKKSSRITPRLWQLILGIKNEIERRYWDKIIY